MKTSFTSRARAAQQFIRRITVPIDFSECSLSGLKYAVEFAKNVGARIIVLHVTDLGPVMMTTACGDYDSPVYLEAARRRCGDQMQAFLKRVDFNDVPVTTCAVAGYCPAAIYEAAEKKGAHLIIISTHGRTGLRHALLAALLKAQCDIPPARFSSCPPLRVDTRAD